MHFIRGIFGGSVGDGAHGFFTKYGRGDFSGPVLGVKVGKGVLRVTGSPEYCGGVGWVLAGSVEGSLDVSGCIYSRVDFRGALSGLGVDFLDKTKKGYYTVELDSELDSGVLKGVYESVGDGFPLLNVKGDKPWSLSSGKKLPKPGGGVKDNFVKASLGGSALGLLMEDLLFDVDGGFKGASVSHRYVIDEVVAPGDVKDPGEARIRAKRKGKVVRTVVVDGSERTSECSLLV
ncbi:MAG: hypothetical protein ABIH11_03665 [Candidatus Altiarchaeota archaeon]